MMSVGLMSVGLKVTVRASLMAAALTLAACDGGDSAPTAGDTPSEAADPAPATPATAPAPAAAAARSENVPANLATTPETALAAMQGEWVSLDDPRATLSIAGNQLTMGYAGDSESLAPMRIDFVTECEGRPVGKERLAFTLTDSEMTLCGVELEVDADNLEYFNAGRGNRLAYRRVTAAAR